MPRLQAVAEDQLALQAGILPAFWHELREQGLVAPEAPLPIDAKGS